MEAFTSWIGKQTERIFKKRTSGGVELPKVRGADEGATPQQSIDEEKYELKGIKALRKVETKMQAQYDLTLGEAGNYCFITPSTTHCNPYVMCKIGQSTNLIQRFYNWAGAYPRGVHVVALGIVGEINAFKEKNVVEKAVKGFPNRTTLTSSITQEERKEDQATAAKCRQLEKWMFERIRDGYIKYKQKDEDGEFEDLDAVMLQTGSREADNGEFVIAKPEDIQKLFEELYNAGEFKDLRLYNNPKTRTAGTGPYKLYPYDKQGRFNEKLAFSLDSMCPNPLFAFDYSRGKVKSLANEKISSGDTQISLKEYLRKTNRSDIRLEGLQPPKKGN